MITCPEGKYSEIMQTARERVDLAALSIDGLKPRRVQTGALILKVPTEDGSGKAGALAEKLQEALNQEEGVRVAMLTKMAELRIRGVDDSVRKDGVVMAIGEAGGCDILVKGGGTPDVKERAPVSLGKMPNPCR